MRQSQGCRAKLACFTFAQARDRCGRGQALLEDMRKNLGVELTLS